MNLQLERRLKMTLSLIVIGCAILTQLHTPVFSWWMAVANISYVTLVLTRDYVIRLDLRSKMGAAAIWLQLLLVIWLSVWSESYFAQIYLFVLIGEVGFYHTLKRSTLFVVVSYLGILACILMYRQNSLQLDLYVLFPRVIDYFAIFGMSTLARIAIGQKNRLAEDNERLQAASRELEEKTRLEERTRISREIHDSVGHTLTSASMGLQTAIHAIHKDKAEVALSMLERTAASIRIGLNDMRNSIHLLRDNAGRVSFKEELVGLIQKTEEQAAVETDCNIADNLPSLSPLVELAVYRALQEGLTNGIRHGGATRFKFKLNVHDGVIRFRLENNGEVPGRFAFGFGLNAMQERVEQAGGTMKAGVCASDSNATERFALELELPAIARKGDASHDD